MEEFVTATILIKQKTLKMLDRKDILNAKILIIDDEMANVQLLKTTLKQRDYLNIHSTTDSREAISLYKEVKPDRVMVISGV